MGGRLLALLMKIWNSSGSPQTIEVTTRNALPAGPEDPKALVPEELTLVTPDQFERAYAEYRRLGPVGLVAIEKRWPSVIPDVDPTKFAELKALCDSVRWTPAAWYNHLETLCRLPDDLAESDRILEEMIAKKFPFLTPEARRDTCSYARFVNR